MNKKGNNGKTMQFDICKDKDLLDFFKSCAEPMKDE